MSFRNLGNRLSALTILAPLVPMRQNGLCPGMETSTREAVYLSKSTTVFNVGSMSAAKQFELQTGVQNTPLTRYQLILRIVVSPPHHNGHIHPLIVFITLLHNGSRPGVFHDRYVYCCVFILSGAVFSYWWLCVVA